MDIVEQLVKLYFNDELYTKSLTELEARRYYSKMLAHGRVQVYLDKCNVIGLIESWRLTYEQLGRVICWTEFDALEEDVNQGDVLYISDIYIVPHKRNNGVLKILMKMLEESNQTAKYGVSRRVKLDKVKYYRVYDKEVAWKKKEND